MSVWVFSGYLSNRCEWLSPSLLALPLTLCQMGQVEGINMKGVIQQEYALSLPGALPDYNQLHQSLTLLKLYAMSLTFFPLIKPLASVEEEQEHFVQPHYLFEHRFNMAVYIQYGKAGFKGKHAWSADNESSNTEDLCPLLPSHAWFLLSSVS